MPIEIRPAQFRSKSYIEKEYSHEAVPLFESVIESEGTVPTKIETDRIFDHAKNVDLKLIQQDQLEHPQVRLERLSIIWHAARDLSHILDSTAIALKGAAVLYEVKVRTAQADRKPEFFLVVNPRKKSISLMRSPLGKEEIKNLFERSHGDPHKLFWQKLAAAEQDPKKVWGGTAEYHPENGKVMHACTLGQKEIWNPAEGGMWQRWKLQTEISMPHRIGGSKVAGSYLVHKICPLKKE